MIVSAWIDRVDISHSSRTGFDWRRLPHYDDLLHDRSLQFWVLNIAGWSGWAAASMLSGLYWEVPGTYNLAVLFGLFTGMLLTLALRRLYQLYWERPLWQRAIALFVGSYAVALVWQISKNVVLYYLWGQDKWEEVNHMSFLVGVLSSYYIILCWSGLYFGIKYYRMLIEERDKALSAISMAQQAQLKMLRYQLNPHFLFNTLNAISTLVLENDGERANGMVTRLSKFLRYSLDNDPMQKVPLSQEVAALRLYLEIERVRFEERLNFVEEVSPEAGRAMIPSMLLQPVIENAIKYAIARSEDGGTIRLSAVVVGGELRIDICDDGPGLEGVDAHSGGTGVGLRNVRDRLRQVYGSAATVTLDAVEPQGLCVAIRLPREERSE